MPWRETLKLAGTRVQDVGILLTFSQAWCVIRVALAILVRSVAYTFSSALTPSVAAGPHSVKSDVADEARSGLLPVRIRSSSSLFSFRSFARAKHPTTTFRLFGLHGCSAYVCWYVRRSVRQQAPHPLLSPYLSLTLFLSLSLCI